MWARPATTPVARPPWGEIGAASSPAPDALPSWVSINAVGWRDANNDGLTAVVPVYSTYRGKTVEAFLLCAHVDAVATGDVRIQLDVGPRADLQAQGAPNDAASTRTLTTLTIASGAGVLQNDPQYLSLGTFSADALDRLLFVDCQRLGSDGADTFAATLYVYGLYFEVVG